MNNLNYIELSGDIPVLINDKTFWLNEEGIKIISVLGPEEFLNKAGSIAIKYLVDE